MAVATITSFRYSHHFRYCCLFCRYYFCAYCVFITVFTNKCINKAALIVTVLPIAMPSRSTPLTPQQEVLSVHSFVYFTICFHYSLHFHTY